MSRPEALKRVREIIETKRATGETFTKDEVHSEALDACRDLTDSALEGLVTWAVDKGDREATKDVPPGSDQLILDGFGPADLDGLYALGEGERIGKEFARIEHMMKHLEISRTNRHAVDEADDKLHAEFELIRPYWKKGWTKRQAIKAYLRANPSKAAG